MPDANEGSVENKYLYNDKELFDDGDLNWLDYGFRNYDAQIGRFLQIDLLTDEYAPLSGYHYALNDPIGTVDVDGLFPGNPLQQMVQCAGQVLSGGGKITLRAAMIAIKIAVSVVKTQLANKTLNQSLSNVAVQKQIADAVMEYHNAENGQKGFLDYMTLGILANNYFKGLNLMAWWEKNDFLKLNRVVIENVSIPDEIKIQIIEAGIKDAQEGVWGIMREGANTGIFISSIGLFPSVGKGIRAPFKTGTQQAIVDAQATRHGSERIAGAGATRGGVLSISGIKQTKKLGKIFKQTDGATVYLHEVTPGRFNAVVENASGKLITTMENWSQKSITRIAKNYGWAIK